MGANGDRSGGVGRPNVPIRAIGRDGPIGDQNSWAKRSANQAPPAFGRGFKFFSEDALVLGIVHMNDLVDKALESAVPPILKDTFEVACKVVEDGARSVRGEMRKLKGDIDALGDPVKDAYSSLG